MAKTIEAKAVISAADKTGSTFDKIAAKMKGVEKVAKSFEGIKAPRFTGDLYNELHRLQLSEKELNGVRKSFAALDQQLKQGPIGAAHYIRAMEEAKGKTVEHWRQIKAGVDEADRAHKRFFKNAGHFAGHTARHVIGGLGAAYVAGHAIKSVAEAAGARNREGIREEIAGFTPEQQDDANRVADEISRRHPSLSRTDVLEDLRKNAARLGSLDRAKEIAETYAKARIFNQINGGDEHELEQVVRAAEGAGAANTPDQFKSFLNGFARARARNPDYTGEDFAKDFRAAGAAKYGLGKDYMENVFPVLASHTPGFGVKLATSNSALIGGRMTKQSKAAMEAAGIWKDGHLVGEREYQDSPFGWVQHQIRPLLEKKGVKFGEDMSVEDKQTVSSFASKTFSAKNVADMVIASLLDATLVAKYRPSKGKDIDSVDEMQHRDAGVAWAGVTKQLGDLGAAAANTSFAIGRMDSAASALANLTHFLQTGEVPLDSRGGRLLNWWKGNSPPLEGPIPLPMSDPRRTADGARIPFPMPDPRNQIPDFPNGVPLPMRDPRRMSDGTLVPMPMSDPRNQGESWQPPGGAGEGTVQAQLTGSAEVRGEVSQTIKIEPSPLFSAMVDRMEAAIKLVGSLVANGPGSTGRSSPDAEPLPRPSAGSPFAGY